MHHKFIILLIAAFTYISVCSFAQTSDSVVLPSTGGGSPDLMPYSRTPLSVKMSRLFAAGQDLFNRRRYEEAEAVFESMRMLDEHDLLSLFWIKKCRERIERERNEQRKQANLRQTGRMFPKEQVYTNWHWGPEVGHFEVRYSQPKPHVEPVKKVRKPASDSELAKFKAEAEKGSAEALFDLAMAHWSRNEKPQAIDALEKAAEINPDILARDDDGLAATVQSELADALEKGKPTSMQLFEAGRIAVIQGELPDAFRCFIRAASEEKALADGIKNRLQKLIDAGKTDFLFHTPEIYSFRQAYICENGEDKLYLKFTMLPRVALPIAPLDLMFEREAVKSIDAFSPDILFNLLDPAATETTRLWVIGKYSEPQNDNPIEIKGKLLFNFDKVKLSLLDLSNFNATPDLVDNWSLVIAPLEAFTAGFPAPQFEYSENGLVVKLYQLRLNTGKGPVLMLDDFRRKPATSTIEVWKVLDNVNN